MVIVAGCFRCEGARTEGTVKCSRIQLVLRGDVVDEENFVIEDRTTIIAGMLLKMLKRN